LGAPPLAQSRERIETASPRSFASFASSRLRVFAVNAVFDPSERPQVRG
jgi:hypothetical protein